MNKEKVTDIHIERAAILAGLFFLATLLNYFF